MTAVFVDTNVLPYAFDDAYPDRRHRSRAGLAACWSVRRGRLSTPVLSEFCANARKRFRDALSAGDARAVVRRFQEWMPWQIDQATSETAWAIESRYAFNDRDSRMVSAAQHRVCTLLLTEDLPHDQRIDGLRNVNPFTVGPEILDAPA